MIKRILITVALLGLGYAPQASARTPLTDAIAAAAQYWQTSPEGSYQLPCNSSFTIKRESATPAGKPNAIGWTKPPECTIYLLATRWTNETTDATLFPEYCQLITHEIGHIILGSTYFVGVNPIEPDHSPDPNNVMYPILEPRAMPAQCLHASDYWTSLPSTEAIERATGERATPMIKPSPRLPIQDELVNWRGFKLKAHTTRVLACATGERLQNKVWTVGGSAFVHTLSATTARVRAQAHTVSIRGACEPVFAESKD